MVPLFRFAPASFPWDVVGFLIAMVLIDRLPVKPKLERQASSALLLALRWPGRLVGATPENGG
jgi:hypothetical protein